MNGKPIGIDASVVTHDGLRAFVAPWLACHVTGSAVRASTDAAPWSLGRNFDTPGARCRVADVEAMLANEATCDKRGCSGLVVVG
jgi:hypothetical protein